MRVLLALALAAAALALAAAAPGPNPEGGVGTHGGQADAPHSRTRRFIVLGWNVSDFFHGLLLRLQRAYLASRIWAAHLFGYAHRQPHIAKEVVIHIPKSHTLVRWIDNLGRGNAHYPLTWDGHRLSWQGVSNASHHFGRTARVDQRLRIYQNDTLHSVPLSALARYLHHVKAHATITIELLGHKPADLRLVLHVHGHGHEHGHRGHEDAAKSVSVLVHKLLQEVDAKKEHHDDSKHSKHAKKQAMRWDGHTLSWKDASRKAHARVKVTQDGVTSIIPLQVVAKHLQHVPAGSDVQLEVRGKTMRDLRIVLHVHVRVHGGHDKTISVPVRLLLKEAKPAVQARGKDLHGGQAKAKVETAASPSHVQKIPSTKQV